jgi:Zn-finger nucleic acid-binding protein
MKYHERDQIVTSNDGTTTSSRQLSCPVCSVTMETLRRENVEFDRCPNCRGVWLDRGELEKLVATEIEDLGQPIYEQSVDDSDEPDQGDKLATRRSWFAELFDSD